MLEFINGADLEVSCFLKLWDMQKLCVFSEFYVRLLMSKKSNFIPQIVMVMVNFCQNCPTFNPLSAPSQITLCECNVSGF